MIGDLGIVQIGPTFSPTRTFDYAMLRMRSLTGTMLALSISHPIVGSMPYFDQWQLSLLTVNGCCELRWVPTARIRNATAIGSPR